jgi:homocysteine S-methyltransferase
MNLAALLRTAPAILTEGAVIERLRRDPAVKLDPHVMHAAMIYTPSARAVLEGIYRQYFEIGRSYGLPMLVGTPTWRANPERLRAAGLAERDVNGDAVRFLQSVRAEYGPYAGSVFLAGLLGCRGDAYDPGAALNAPEAVAFHQVQARALVAAGVDGLLAAALPAATEALGMAQALAAAAGEAVPYILSFIIRPTGTLLDATPLGEVVAQIDAQVTPPPAGYMVNCVHPAIFGAALERELARCPTLGARLLGLQGNTSRLSPEELDGAARLDTEEPEVFARELLAVRRRFGLRIVGGCCGTDARHMRGVAAGLVRG